jgi:hypothetical protein
MITAVLLVGLLGCNHDKKALIMEKVAERTVVYRSKKLADCRNTLIQEASVIVDSLLLQEARLQLNDSLSRSKPTKPYKPLPVPPIDSEAVLPIFKQ